METGEAVETGIKGKGKEEHEKAAKGREQE